MSKCTIDDILEFAITGEIAASKFYLDMASEMKDPAIAKAFTEFAKEEQGHSSKLKAIKQDKTIIENASTSAKVADLKIADYTVDVNQPCCIFSVNAFKCLLFFVYCRYAYSVDVPLALQWPALGMGSRVTLYFNRDAVDSLEH